MSYQYPTALIQTQMYRSLLARQSDPQQPYLMPQGFRMFNLRRLPLDENLNVSDWIELAQQSYHHSIDGGLYHCFNDEKRSVWIGQHDVRDKNASDRAQKLSSRDGGLQAYNVRTTYPLSSDIAEPPPNHVRMLVNSALQLDSTNWAVRLIDDDSGNARWTTATAYIDADPLPTMHPAYLAVMNVRRDATFPQSMSRTKHTNDAGVLYEPDIESSTLPKVTLSKPSTSPTIILASGTSLSVSETRVGTARPNRKPSSRTNGTTGPSPLAGEEAQVNAILEIMGHRLVQYDNRRGQQIDIPLDLYLRLYPQRRATSFSEVMELDKTLKPVSNWRPVKLSAGKDKYPLQESIVEGEPLESLWWRKRIQDGIALPSDGVALREIYETFGRLKHDDAGRSAFAIALRMHYFATIGRTAWCSLPPDEQMQELTDALEECQKRHCPETAKFFTLAAIKQVTELKNLDIKTDPVDEDSSGTAEEGEKQFLLDTTEALWNRIAYSPASNNDRRRPEILGRVQHALNMRIKYAYKVISLCMASALWPSHTFRITSYALQRVRQHLEIQLRYDQIPLDRSKRQD